MVFAKYLKIPKAKGFSLSSVEEDYEKSYAAMEIETHEIPQFINIYHQYESSHLNTFVTVEFFYKKQKCAYRHPIEVYSEQVPLRLGLEKFLREDFGMHEYVISEFIKQVQSALIPHSNSLVLHKDTIVSNPSTFAGSEFANFIPYSDKYKKLEDEALIAEASKSLPGMTTVVDLPCGCAKMSLWRAVQHLNDVENWTREGIADWVDELHDSGVVNAEFEPWNDSKESSEITINGWTELGYTTLEENE